MEIVGARIARPVFPQTTIPRGKTELSQIERFSVGSVFLSSFD